MLGNVFMSTVPCRVAGLMIDLIGSAIRNEGSNESHELPITNR